MSGPLRPGTLTEGSVSVPTKQDSSANTNRRRVFFSMPRTPPFAPGHICPMANQQRSGSVSDFLPILNESPPIVPASRDKALVGLVPWYVNPCENMVYICLSAAPGGCASRPIRNGGQDVDRDVLFSMIKRMSTLGRELVAARAGQHKTLRGLAKEAEISPALLSLIERDKHVPGMALVVRLAGLLNVDGDYLCALVGRITPAAEKHLAQIAREDPKFFRSMVDRLRS